jgi:signal transduction histidine kinase
MRGLTSHPEFERWLPLLVLPPVLVTDALLGSDAGDVTVLGVLGAYVGCLPLLVRRRAPFWLTVLLLVAGIIVVLQGITPGTTVVLIPAWALFDLARNQGGRQAAGAIAVVPLAVLFSILPTVESASEAVSLLLRNAAICELALVVGLLVRRTREAHERELRAAGAEAARAAGEERLRIAQDVHDVVAHAMVAISVQSGVAIHRLDRDPDAGTAREALAEIRRTSGDALDELRATLGILRDPTTPAPVAPAGMGELEPLAARLRTAGIDVRLDVGPLPGLSPASGAVAYRVVQESLTNVLRHAGASEVAVRVRTDGPLLRIDVTDDGSTGGTRAPSVRPTARAATDVLEPPTGAGQGLRGMRERLEALGGRLDAEPRDPSGWHVRATLPLVAP